MAEAGYPTGIRMDGHTIVSADVPGECYVTATYRIGGVEFSGTAKVIVYKPVKKYPGPYIITPKAEMQTLETEECLMTENVIVLPIPYAEIPNSAGGVEFVIGD